MCPTARKKRPQREVFPFTYPKLHSRNSWYVDFYSYDPAEGKMRRKKFMLDHIKPLKLRRQHAAEMIALLTQKLRIGWSPWISEQNSRAYTLLADALTKYEASVEKMPRYKTRKSYTSRLNILREYISSLVLPPRYVYQFDAAFITEFLDWIYLDRECSARTRNNYRGWCSSLAAFFIERQYLQENPVDKVRTISETPKKRQPLSAEMLRTMSAYLKTHDPYYLLACRMEYYTFIRPEELSHVKISDISLEDGSIYVPASVSKNKRDGKVALNKSLINLMLSLDIFSAPGDYYLFGKDLKPSSRRADSEIFRKKWLKLRKALRWGDEYQFYSLKDSGIRDLANDRGIIIARDQARHSDVATTNKYLQGRDLPVHPEAQSFEGNL